MGAKNNARERKAKPEEAFLRDLKLLLKIFNQNPLFFVKLIAKPFSFLIDSLPFSGHNAGKGLYAVF